MSRQMAKRLELWSAIIATQRYERIRVPHTIRGIRDAGLDTRPLKSDNRHR
jgi:hypothetical protein